MSPNLKLAAAIAGLPIAAIAAVVVVVAGSAVSGGASPAPATWPPPPPSIMPVSQEQLERDQATIDALLDDALQGAPTLVATEGWVYSSLPTRVRIGDFELTEGMRYMPEVIWTSNPHPDRAASGFVYFDDSGRSSVYFYADTREVLQQEVLPLHEAFFAEVLLALGTGAPITEVFDIGTTTIELPEGVEYGEVIWSTRPDAERRTAGAITHVGETGISRLYIDPVDGRVLRNAILPEHVALFAPVLTALDQPQ